MNSPKNKVALVAYNTTRDQAPFGSDEHEVWGLNAVGKYMDNELRFDRMFDPHPYGILCGTVEWGAKLDWYRCWGGPVYMLEEHPDLPESIAYPIEEVTKFMQPYHPHGPYFPSTHAYMIALALMEGFKGIEIYGFTMGTAKEKGAQRAGVEFYLGLAMGLGLKVGMPEEEWFVRHDHMYGYDNDPTESFNSGNMIGLLSDAASKLGELGRVLNRQVSKREWDEYAIWQGREPEPIGIDRWSER